MAGTPGATGSTDGPGSVALFNDPTGIAIDSTGNLYVADTANSTVRLITTAGFVTTLAGSAGMTGSTNGSGSAALFNSPQAITADSAGNLYIADTFNDSIREISSSGAVTTLAGSAGNPGSDDGTGSAARFYHPSGIAIDGLGNLYIADTLNQTIRTITAAGTVTTSAGAPQSEGVMLGALPGSINQPSGLALLAGPGTSLIVADPAENSILLVTLH
jgi:sugar lactone lactonase YvrE